jgi:hypothetical protein
LDQDTRFDNAETAQLNILSVLRHRFAEALADIVVDPAPLVDLVRPSQGSQFGDYQANCAMPLGKQLGRPPREVSCVHPASVMTAAIAREALKACEQASFIVPNPFLIEGSFKPDRIMRGRRFARQSASTFQNTAI